MKLRTVKKYLFREIRLDNHRQVKPAQNSSLFLEFSEHKKYRKPLKGLNFHSKRCNFYDTPEKCERMAIHDWEKEKYEWFQLMRLIHEFPIEYYKMPNNFRSYAKAYCQWYEAHFGKEYYDD